MSETEIEVWSSRRQANPKPRLTFLDEITVERGTREDWHLLEALHYKAHGITPGAHYYVMKLRGETIGVLMMASPKLLLKERHVAFPRLKPHPGEDNKTARTARMKWINANMSIVARCVVDTMYRGAGLAYRFVNIASRMERRRYIEIQSAMSKYNQFAQKGGFRFVRPMASNKYEIGVKFMRQTFESDPADLEALLEEIAAMPPAVAESVRKKVRAFYRRHSSLENTGKANVLDAEGVKFADNRVARLSDREILSQMQQMILASPLYGFYPNPDIDRDDLPSVIPITAFDNQRPDEPLRLDMLPVGEEAFLCAA